MVDVTDFPEVVRKREFDTHTAGIVKCPSGCGGEIAIAEDDLAEERGVEGSARCSECGDMIRYTSPQGETGFNKLGME